MRDEELPFGAKFIGDARRPYVMVQYRMTDASTSISDTSTSRVCILSGPGSMRASCS